MRIKHRLRTSLWRLGYDVSRFTPRDHPVARRRRLLESGKIDLVLDIGANRGQYALQLRNELSYNNDIVSFEPLSTAFSVLTQLSSQDRRWRALNIGLGDSDRQDTINVSGNSYSSSLLDILPTHVNNSPESAYIGRESVQIRRLDSFFDDICSDARNIYMKIDTQGYEWNVLQGSDTSLDRIRLVQLEMSLVPLYKGQKLFSDLYAYMAEKGFTLVSIEPGFSDAVSGELLQVDGIFSRAGEA